MKKLFLITLLALMSLDIFSQVSAIYDVVVFRPMDGRADQLAISVQFHQVPNNTKDITIIRSDGVIMGQWDYMSGGHNLFLIGDYQPYQLNQYSRDFTIRVDTHGEYMYEEDIFSLGNRYYNSSGDYLCDFPDGDQLWR